MFAEQWQDYRKRRLMFWSVLLGGFLFAAVGILLYQMLPANIADPMTLAIGAAWMLACVVAANRLNFWRCPRCHKYYFVRTLFRNPLARQCLHCGLEKWDEGEV